MTDTDCVQRVLDLADALEREADGHDRGRAEADDPAFGEYLFGRATALRGAASRIRAATGATAAQIRGER